MDGTCSTDGRFFFFFLCPFCLLERLGVSLDLIPRLPLILRITIYSRQVISLALEAGVVQLYPQALGSHFSRLLRHS
jgi:hypothetical protein